MISILAVAAGSALGGILRYWVDTRVSRRLGTGFPWGTLLVNASGALVAGAIAAWLAGPGGGFTSAPALLVIGLCGSYTTVSSFSLQTVSLALQGRLSWALYYVLASLFICLLGAWSGFTAISALGGGTPP